MKSMKRVTVILMALLISAGISPVVPLYAATPAEGNTDIGCYEYGYESYGRRTPKAINESFNPSDYGEDNTSFIYVAADGSDETGDGTQGAPYASLKKAASVAESGDTIKLGAGEFEFTESVDIPLGVSLEGEGDDTVITADTLVNTGNGGRDAIVRLQTEDIVEDGNQHVSHLTFNGHATAAWAIDVTNRNNVAVHDCTVENFCEAGVGWHSTSLSSKALAGTNPDVSTVDGTFVTGGRFYNNYLKDNTRFADGWGRGSLFMCGLEDFHIYNNKMIEDLKTSPDGTRGVPLKAWYYGGWMRDIKIHDNDIQRLGSSFYSSDGTGWDFAIEMDAPYAGVEICNNHFIGAVDLNGGFTNVGGITYDYSGWIHDNSFTADTTPKIAGDNSYCCEEYAFTLERKTQKMLIEYNTVSGYKTPVFFNAREIISDVTIRYNLCTELGAEGNTVIYLSGVDEVNQETGEHIFGNSITVKNLAIYNNVFSGRGCGLGVCLGQDMRSAWTLENVEVSNNVIDGCIWPWFSVTSSPTSVNGLNLENNIVHQDAGITMPDSGVSGFVNANNTTLNDTEWAAAFGEDWCPAEGSPAIDGGKNITSGLVDLAGNAVPYGGESDEPEPVRQSISNASVSGISDKTYTGGAVKTVPTVKVGSETLKAGRDYTLSYKNNVSVGTATVTITGKGDYKDSIKRTFKINPKGTSLKGFTASSKAVRVRWNRQATKMSSSRITGYRIQLATNSSFTSNKKTVTVKGYSKISKTVSGLKGGRKYYVRVRTYKNVGGTSYYSPWSKVRTVKVKK